MAVKRHAIALLDPSSETVLWRCRCGYEELLIVAERGAQQAAYDSAKRHRARATGNEDTRATTTRLEKRLDAVIAAIREGGPMTVNELADRLGIPAGSVHRYTSRLLGEGVLWADRSQRLNHPRRYGLVEASAA